jgi:hypothetical protein
MKNKAVDLDFDIRMVEWNLKHEVIDKDQLKQYLKSLPDEESNATQLSLEGEEQSNHSAN